MKENKFEIIAYTILFIGILFIGLLPPPLNNDDIKFCRIDSMYVRPSDEFIPEIRYKYWTDCGYSFSTKKKYYIGDSIQVKIVTIE